MRIAIVLVVSLGMAACRYPELPQLSASDAHGSGDSGGTIDGSVDGRVDAPPDAPHVCYPPATLGNLSAGTAANPLAGNFFDTPGSGPVAGMKEFVFAAQLNQQAPINVFAIEVVKPTTGFVVNQPYAFSTDANPNLAYTARAYILGDYDTTTGNHKQYLYATGGSITFTAIGETINSSINASISMTSYKEVDETTGAVVPNGCTTALMGMTLYLRQNM